MIMKKAVSLLLVLIISAAAGQFSEEFSTI
jgi:hypothetical protein